VSAASAEKDIGRKGLQVEESWPGDPLVSDRIIAIISTGEAGKARTGTKYAINALKNGSLEDVKLFFFGPAEKLL
jgi:hypothetical protein